MTTRLKRYKFSYQKQNHKSISTHQFVILGCIFKQALKIRNVDNIYIQIENFWFNILCKSNYVIIGHTLAKIELFIIKPKRLFWWFFRPTAFKKLRTIALEKGDIIKTRLPPLTALITKLFTILIRYVLNSSVQNNLNISFSNMQSSSKSLLLVFVRFWFCSSSNEFKYSLIRSVKGVIVGKLLRYCLSASKSLISKLLQLSINFLPFQLYDRFLSDSQFLLRFA